MNSSHRLRRFAGITLVALILTACSASDANVARLNQDVQQITVGEPYPISARSLAAAMLQAGFSSDEVLEYGPRVRNAIGSSGGAQINKGKYADAIFSVQDSNLYVSSRDGGTFIRDL